MKSDWLCNTVHNLKSNNYLIIAFQAMRHKTDLTGYSNCKLFFSKVVVEFQNTLMSSLMDYVNNRLIHSIQHEVGKCKPISAAFNTTLNSVCSRITTPAVSFYSFIPLEHLLLFFYFTFKYTFNNWIEYNMFFLMGLNNWNK